VWDLRVAGALGALSEEGTGKGIYWGGALTPQQV